MSAEELGKKILSEVDVVRMDELLRSLWHLNDNIDAAYEFNIQPLDRIVREATAPARQNSNHQRLAGRQSSIPPSDARAVSQPPVIEFTSTSPGVGKTNLLYLIAAVAVVPQKFRGHELNGRNNAVVVVDPDDRFDASRLADVMCRYLESRLPGNLYEHKDETKDSSKANEMADLLSFSLRHIHIFRPQSLQSLLATVQSLEAYLFDTNAHQSSQRPLGAIILDGASSFYWQHRVEEDAARLREPDSGAASRERPKSIPAHSLLATALKNASKTFDCPLLFTSQSSAFENQTSRGFEGRPSSTIRSLLPPSWTSMANARFLFERVRTLRFAVGMTAEEAWAERKMRQEVVDRGLFRACLVGGSRERAFDFSVHGNGVAVVT